MKHTADTRKPYSGLSRSLVIAIDVGTTFSGVSYAVLEPGEIPKILGVTRFPGQEHVAGNSKIPSVIYYDKYGTVMAAGAEADNSSVVAQAEDENWIKAELFKLRLRPRTMQLNMNGMRLSPLPKKKTPVHVFGDYLSYLHRCTRSYITDTHANGRELWDSVENDIQFVLSHPNGWEGPQQTRMRNAAVYGRLVPDTDEGRARIRFVTEGEASLHACVLNGLAADVLSSPSKNGFLIADAGGGTLDISAYAIKGTSPLTMEEIAPPDCIFAGSIFVSRRAREFFESKLKNSKYGTPDAVDHITRRFDETTKRLFRDKRELQFVHFGSPLDKDITVGIRSGQLKLTGNEVANLFEPSVDAALNAIKSQIKASSGSIKSVFLVGGYAASPWLFGQLQETLHPIGVKVSRPDTQTSKAVADGAVGFYCDHHVSARMSKYMYGVEFLRELNPDDPDHVARREKLCELPSGPKLLPDAFDCILARSVKVKESTVFTRKYCTELTNLSMLSVFEVEIWCYRGGNTIPKWIERHHDAFSTLCVVQADLSMLSGSAEPKKGRNGKNYWTIVFSVEIHFGLTEFKARIKWMDNGQVKYGPAVIVYNERGHRIEDSDIDTYPEDDMTVNTPRSERERDRRSEHPSSPSSHTRTPVDSSYPPPTSSSRRQSSAGLPDPSRVERSSSKGYSPSVAPSAKTAISASRSLGGSGSDADRTGSDSDRRKGKERESRYRDEERGLGTARSSMYSSNPMSRVASNASNAPHPPTPPTAIIPEPAYPPAAWNDTPSPQPPAPKSPSIRQPSAPHSRAPSTYASPRVEPPHDINDGTGFANVSTPRTVADRQSLWGEPPTGSPGQSLAPQFDGSPHIHDHHISSYDRPTSGVPPSWDEPQATAFDIHRSPLVQNHSVHASPNFHSGDRPKSPFAAEHAPSPYDRPNSVIDPIFGGDRPKSVFAEPPAGLFDTGYSPGAAGVFGDSGPAADLGGPGDHAGSHAIFGEPPAAVFGNANDNNDSWGFTTSNPVTPAAETPSGKKKKKGSGAATPASGIASHTSPAISNKSPKGIGLSPQPAVIPEVEDVVFNAASTSPNLGANLNWGLTSKGASPFGLKDKPLSPLNPAAHIETSPGHIHQEPAPAADNNTGSWGGGGGWGFGSSADTKKPAGDTWDLGSSTDTTKAIGDNWGFASNAPGKSPGGWGSTGISTSFNDGPSTIEPPVPVTPAVEVASSPIVETPLDESKVTTAGKKKKKKGAATTKVNDLFGDDDAAEKERVEKEKRDKEDQERKDAEERARQEEERLRDEADAQRIAAEMEQQRKEKAEIEARERAEQEARERAEQEKAEQEREKQEKAAQEARDKAEKEAKEKEEKEKAAAQETSLFGSTGALSGALFSSSQLNPPDKPWVATDVGGGDDTWGSSWGAPVAVTGKKKKGKLNATPTTPSVASKFGFGSGTGTGWGSTPSAFGFSSSAEPVPSPKPSPKPASTELPSTTNDASNLFNFESNSGFTLDPLSKPVSRPPSRLPSRAPSPAPEPALEVAPVETAEDGGADLAAADGDNGGDNGGDADDDGGAGASGKKKKKKKKDGATAEVADVPPTPKEEEPPAAAAPEPASTAAKKKKKKK